MFKYAPEANSDPTPGVTRDMASFQQIPIYITQVSDLGPLGPLVFTSDLMRHNNR